MGISGLLLFCCLGFLSGVNTEDFEQPPSDELRWEKNPFIQSTEALGIQDLQLTAIVYNPTDAACLINGKVLRKGERIGGAEILHIEQKQVVLRNENGLFRLALQ
ncbi:MAG: hypothetical protein Q7S68_00170 [Deltaproteobacteria bacterium]|nr:hypothetical protein [Deltaproteobacteria bacterium]